MQRSGTGVWVVGGHVLTQGAAVESLSQRERMRIDFVSVSI